MPDVLDDAGLISRNKTGRIVVARLQPKPMREAMEWLRRYERFWNTSVGRLTTLVEARETEARQTQAGRDKPKGAGR
ncbi:MAG TPA: hypothetical protein VJ476_03895 [Rhizomicrobium sp.]|nr:hypothetical protein [Rhizomicrobium sp.]